MEIHDNLRYWAHGFELGVHGTCFQEYGVLHGFVGMWYIVSDYPVNAD